MDCWARLGIQRTSDTALIRKAYKQKLLIHHPEEDPVGYQTIREAYTEAMSEAKRMEGRRDEDRKTAASVEAHLESMAAPINRLPEDEFGHEQPKRQESFVANREDWTVDDRAWIRNQNDFITRMTELIDGDRCNDAEAWKELLSDDVLWDFQSKPAIEDWILRLFSERYHRLNDDTWRIIESYTGLFGKLTKQLDQYPARFVDAYVLATQKIEVPRNLKNPAEIGGKVVRKSSVHWWKYCFGFLTGRMIFLLAVLTQLGAIPIYFAWVTVRIILYVFRRNWKIILWEYTFTYINRWGIRSDYKYIDIQKIVDTPDRVIIYLKNRRIRIDAYEVENLEALLAKMCRYSGVPEGTP
jgi:curved DNA-binding protein CbpA